MSNDALSLSDRLTQPPEKADYDAMYEALTATERGRRFLTEYDSRTRRTETQRLLAALARVEAAIRDGALPLAHPDLVEIVAAVDRLKVEIAAGGSPPPNGLDAVERLQDIAFLLHERSIDPKLCAEFDAALREISEVCARSDLAAKRAQKVKEMVAALASRVSEMIALSAGSHIEKAKAWVSAVALPSNDDLWPPRNPITTTPMDRTSDRSHMSHQDTADKPSPSRVSSGLELPTGPEEDPADLFEQELGVRSDAINQRTVSPPVESITGVGGRPASPTAPSPAATDPLAAVRALSEEELIALFS